MMVASQDFWGFGVRSVGLISFIAAPLSIFVFIASGAGAPLGTRALISVIGEPLGAAAGHPGFFIGGLLFLLLGLGSLCRRGPEGAEALPTRELTQFALASFASAFLTLTILGVAHGYEPQTVAVCFVTALLETVLAIGTGVLVAGLPERHRGLYGAAIALTLMSLAVEGGILVYMSGV